MPRERPPTQSAHDPIMGSKSREERDRLELQSGFSSGGSAGLTITSEKVEGRGRVYAING